MKGKKDDDSRLIHYMRQYKWLTRKSVVQEIARAAAEEVGNKMQAGANPENLDVGTSKGLHFVTLTADTKFVDIPDEYISPLFRAMKARTKPISKRATPAFLGALGKEGFQRMMSNEGEGYLATYASQSAVKVKCPSSQAKHAFNECSSIDHVEFPFCIELAVLHRKEDGRGLKVLCFVNRMPTMSSTVFDRLYDVGYHLGRVWIRKNSPVTVAVHFLSPVIEWLNFGKSEFYDADASSAMEDLFNKCLPMPAQPRIYSEAPRTKLDNKPKRFVNGELSNFADWLRASMKVQARLMTKRGWCYIMENIKLVVKSEFGRAQKRINECIAEDLINWDDFIEEESKNWSPVEQVFPEQTEPSREAIVEQAARAFKNVSVKEIEASFLADYWKTTEYFLVVVTEKIDLYNILKPACDKYHIPILNGKGWESVSKLGKLARLFKKGESLGLKPKLLYFGDWDFIGDDISKLLVNNINKYAKNFRWTAPADLVDRVGLDEWQIKKHDFPMIPYERKGKKKDRKDKRFDEWVKNHGNNKCECNVFVVNADLAIEYLVDKIHLYWGQDVLDRFTEKEREVQEKVRELMEELGLDEVLQRVVEPQGEDAR